MKLSALRSLVVLCIIGLPLLGLYRWQAGLATAPVQRQAGGTLSGQAEVLRAGETEWRTTSKENIAEGDSIRAASNVRLSFAEGSVINMFPGAFVSMSQIGSIDGSIVVFHHSGRLGVETNNPLFRLESPSLGITVEKAAFRVEVDEAGVAYVFTERGLIYTQSEGNNVAVAAGESLRAGVGQRATLQPTTPVALPPPPPPPPRTPTPTATPVPPTQPPQRVHIITQGDTLTYLATMYSVSVDDIVKANGITDPHMLSIGQRLIIPPSK
jgi:hypothetical protein